mmetsp:Transcript_11631/g.31345  ORF Transcript_11631/g.31345 Transcript_11631/m.31345 type:complete len:232 (-) Transcript_11631:533-1228(-)
MIAKDLKAKKPATKTLPPPREVVEAKLPGKNTRGKTSNLEPPLNVAAAPLEPKLRGGEVEQGHRGLAASDDGTCYTLYAQDSYGDGWNGGSWTWTDDDGAVTVGTVDSADGQDWVQSTLCPGSGGCGVLYVDDGSSYASEQYWSLVDAAGSAIASGSGTADIEAAVCDGVVSIDTFAPTSAPTPVPTSVPTVWVCEDSADWYKAGKPSKDCGTTPRFTLSHLPTHCRRAGG